MFPYEYLNPSFPLGNEQEEDRGCFFSYETVDAPFGEVKTSSKREEPIDIMDPRKYVNPSFPLRNWRVWDSDPLEPFDENETAESLYAKYFGKPKESKGKNK